MQPELSVNILLVDDYPENLLALEALLEGLGQNLVKAYSGKEALKCLLNQDFAVILLDVQMPEIDGFETAALIRARPRSQDTPIIFLTAFSKTDALVTKGYSLGAVDYLIKPIEPQILRAKVTVFVELFQKTAQVKQQAAQLAAGNREIQTLNAELEERVMERTAELAASNQQKADLLAREQAARAQAQAAEQRFRDLVNGLGGAIVWEREAETLRFTFVSQSAEGVLGYPAPQWLAEPDCWANLLHPEDREWVMAFYRDQDRRDEVEYRCVTAAGEVVWLRDRIYVVRDVAGQVQKLRGLMLDITQRQQAEAALQARTEELTRLNIILTQTAASLEKRNRELDQFAYVTSHDLKAPLRAIANLSEWIEEDLSDKLTEETQHQMNLLRGRVHRMTALIDGLLQYSRIGRVQSDEELVDLEALLAEIIDSLAPPPEFTVEVAAGMPTIRTERLHLQQVFSNLLSNALKHHHRPDGWVKISSQDQGDYYEFAVADNGPGIDPQFHEKVFGIFQTLEARDKAENTGIGLSLVKKLVESKGGNIYLESQPGQGTTFRFTWPKSLQRIAAA